MAAARQHHYVQARYLDGFIAPGSTQLVCYGRGRSKPHRSIPDGIATQRDFYAIPNGLPGANIETFLESEIERHRVLRSSLVLQWDRGRLDSQRDARPKPSTEADLRFEGRKHDGAMDTR